ncbi:MAG: HEAT repeat domain-containing protein, partial [Proteobacteria bacterium]|nr:HEAT repeat domain-containing protein [Pseudomonadota bacterium]
YAQAIGILGNLEVLGDSALTEALPALDKAAKDRSFIQILLESGNALLVRLAVERYRDLLGIGGLINLLDNGDPGVRLTAVKSLKDVNEIAVLKIIIDKYETEKDPAVRKAYQDSFWMIKGREERK